MRFKPKAKRARANRRDDVNFDDYSWDKEKEAGWHPFVILNAKEKPTSKGDDMWVIDFGIDMPDGEGARIRWHVPETFIPKVEMMQEVLLAEYEEEDDDFELEPKVLMFRTCVGLVEVDEDFEREDGSTAWQVVKIIKDEDAEAELGADWQNERAGASSGADQGDDGDEPADGDEPVF